MTLNMESSSTHKVPLVIKKSKISLLKKDCFTNDAALLRCMKVTRPLFVKEDVIYKSEPGDFMRGEYPNLTIINKLNILTNSSRTTAKYSDAALGSIDRTSDEVAKLIGQKNYDVVLSALCSVISQELRIQGILALLTIQKSVKSNFCQTNDDSENNLSSGKTKAIDAESQTDETCYDLLYRLKTRRKIKRPSSTPYVVQNTDIKTLKRVIVEPKHFETTKKLIKLEKDVLNPENNLQVKSNEKNNIVAANFKFMESNTHSDSGAADILDCSIQKESNIKNEKTKQSYTSFPELRGIVDEDSNISDTSCGNISITSSSIPLIVEDPDALLKDIDKHTQESNNLFPLILPDGSQVKIRGKPEDQFHIATAETLKYLNPADQSKVMWYQAYIDFKYCLQRDEDYNLPIHLAVLNNDVDLLRRQCVVLKSRNESVDIPAHSNLTALQMSIFQDSATCTALLLSYGANPLATDDEQRTTIHLAAEVTPDHLRAVIDHCKKNARAILHENDMWKEELKDKSDQDISKYLLSKACRMIDNQGYTPLIVASKLGNYTNAKVLLDADPGSVNLPMPNCGNTALYVAVAAACVDAENNNNKSKTSDHFLRTVEVLVKHGADPATENNSGNSVNLLLNEVRLNDMTMLMANAMVASKYPENETEVLKDFAAYMLVKEETGEVNIKELKTEKKSIKTTNKTSKFTLPTDLIAKPTVTSGTFKILGANKSPHEIVLYANKTKTIKEEPALPTPKNTLTKPPPLPGIKLLPIITKSGIKNISIDGNVKSSPKPNILKVTPKMVTVSKVNTGNQVNLVNVPIKATSTVTLSTGNATTVKAILKRQPLETKPRDQTRDVPIKKQKRDLDQ